MVLGGDGARGRWMIIMPLNVSVSAVFERVCLCH